MSLGNWVKNGWLVEHKSSAEEIRNLLELASRDLRNCQVPGLDADWRFTIAYNAALQSAVAALAAAGYRAGRDSHHYRVIESLEHTVKTESALIRRFDAFRKKRNISSYEASGRISDQEANHMVTLAKDLRQRVEGWIRNEHGELLEESS